MIKYLIKRPTAENPKIWEWKTYQKEGTTWVGPVEFDFKKDAEEVAKEWAPEKYQIVEVNVPDN